MRTQLLLLFAILTFTLSAEKRPVATDKTANEFANVDAKVLLMPDSISYSTDKIAQYIGKQFRSDKDRVRAIYYWIATHIEYDVKNMMVKHPDETPAQRNRRTLKTRKGICENYALLFTTLCQNLKIPAYIVAGYTRQESGIDNLSHAWCAAYYDRKWRLFDPTWGAGYIDARTRRYISKVNNDYFNTLPSEMIKNHIPFDPLWQFLNYPITNEEFYKGEFEENKSKPYFEFKDTIRWNEKQSELQQTINEAKRVKANGVVNQLIVERLKYLYSKVDNMRLSTTVDFYNGAVADFNRAVSLYNEFVQYKNRQFTPLKRDIEIQAMVDSVDNRLNQAVDKLNQIKYADAALKKSIQQLGKSVNQAAQSLAQQQDWLERYFAKGADERASMFYTRTVTRVRK